MIPLHLLGNSTETAVTILVTTCNGAFKGSLNMGAETQGDDNIEKNLQKTLPNGLKGHFILDVPFNLPPIRFNDCETFIVLKSLASFAMADTECLSATCLILHRKMRS